MSAAGTRFRVRWAVNNLSWQPLDQELVFLVSILPAEEAAGVRRFKLREDQKRALLSRLLQRACVHKLFGVEWNEIRLERTKGRKPFYARQDFIPEAPNFNFNVSHEGDFVVLASEPICIVGIDVSAPQQIRRGTSEPFTKLFQAFERQFSSAECQLIQSAGNEEAQEAAFRKHWSLKEAFVKARGDGIAFDLRKADFRLQQAGSIQAITPAVLLCDGMPQSRSKTGTTYS